MRVDYISLVERCYALDGLDEEWLDRLVATAVPLLDRGLGVFGYLWSASALPVISYVAATHPALPAVVRRINAAASPALLLRAHASGTGLTTSSEATGLGEGLIEDPAWRHEAHPLGIRDCLGINVLADPAGFGCLIGTLLPQVERVRQAERRPWVRLAAHLGASLRLRRTLSRAPSLDDAEAVLTPSGRIEHASDAARTSAMRERLRNAAVAIDRARGPLRRRDPEAALELWRGLVAGRWSLVEHFERSGRRFLVAPRPGRVLPDGGTRVTHFTAGDAELVVLSYPSPAQEGHLPRDAAAALTASEREVLVLLLAGQSRAAIVRARGRSRATIARQIEATYAKLGVSSRAELAVLCA